jgi:vanadium chloroperoxidase
MALGALYDGYVLATGGTPILSLPMASATALDPKIVGAAACHQLLLQRYPKQTSALNAYWDFWIRLFPISSSSLNPSESYGRTVGNAVNLLGISDRQIGSNMMYTPGGPYTHNLPPTEPMQGFAGPAWGGVSRLVTPQRVMNFAPPPGRTGPTTVIPNAHFAADFVKVQSKGAYDTRARTGGEEVTGIYWGYDGPPELGTPPRLYMQVVLAVLDEIEVRNPGGLQEQEELQIIAATGLAMADAGIDAWYYKYSAEHMMWRPVLGIRFGLGALAPAESTWLPLGRPDTNGTGVSLTPNFPAYPSGHATFGAAAFQLLRTFLVHKELATFSADGLDNVAFSFISDEFNGRNTDPRPETMRLPRPILPQRFSSLWHAITDNSVSRVYLGVHWQFDGVTIKGTDPDGEFGIPSTPSQLGRRGGVWLGCQLANQVAARICIPPEVIAASIP